MYLFLKLKTNIRINIQQSIHLVVKEQQAKSFPSFNTATLLKSHKFIEHLTYINNDITKMETQGYLVHPLSSPLKKEPNIDGLENET